MRNVMLLGSLLFATACGQEVQTTSKADGYLGQVQDKLKATQDNVGEVANEKRKFLSDKKGMSSEEVGYEISTADDIADEQYVAGRDHAGKKANEGREYTYSRGIEEMRHGDQDTTNKVKNNTGDIDENAKKIAKLEKALEEAVEALGLADSVLAKELDKSTPLIAQLQDETEANEATILVLTEELANDKEALATHIEEYFAAISALQSDVDGNAAGVSENAAEIVALSSDFITLASKVDENADKIAELEDELSEANTEMVALQAQIDANDGDIAYAHSRISSLQSYTRYLGAGISSLRREDSRLRGQLNSLSSSLYSFQRYQRSVNARVGAQLSSLRRSVSRLQRALRNKVRNLQQQITNVQNQTNGNSSLLAAFGSILTNIVSDIQDLETAVEENGDDIDALETGLVSVVNTANAAHSRINATNANVSRLNSYYRSLSSRVSTLQASLNNKCQWRGNSFWYFFKKYRKLKCGSSESWVRVKH